MKKLSTIIKFNKFFLSEHPPIVELYRYMFMKDYEPRDVVPGPLWESALAELNELSAVRMKGLSKLARDIFTP